MRCERCARRHPGEAWPTPAIALATVPYFGILQWLCASCLDYYKAEFGGYVIEKTL